MHSARDTLQHVIKAWWKVGDRRQEKHRQVLPVFFFVNEHNNTITKPQAKKQRLDRFKYSAISIKWEWKLLLPLQYKSNDIKKDFLTKDSSSLGLIYKVSVEDFVIDSDI